MTRKERLPVIDAEESGNGSIYGYATTPRGAMRVARRYFADPIACIERAEWKPGVPAFLALTIYGADHA